MIWIAVLLPLLLFIARLLYRRADRVPILPGQPMSTLNSAMSKRTNKKTKAALDAATLLLR